MQSYATVLKVITFFNRHSQKLLNQCLLEKQRQLNNQTVYQSYETENHQHRLNTFSPINIIISYSVKMKMTC